MIDPIKAKIIPDINKNVAGESKDKRTSIAVTEGKAQFTNVRLTFSKRFKKIPPNNFIYKILRLFHIIDWKYIKVSLENERECYVKLNKKDVKVLRVNLNKSEQEVKEAGIDLTELVHNALKIESKMDEPASQKSVKQDEVYKKCQELLTQPADSAKASEAVKQLTQLAEEGYAPAGILLSLVYEHGAGAVEKDPVQQKKWADAFIPEMKKKAQRGDDHASSDLAMYNFKKALGIFSDEDIWEPGKFLKTYDAKGFAEGLKYFEEAYKKNENPIIGLNYAYFCIKQNDVILSNMRKEDVKPFEMYELLPLVSVFQKNINTAVPILKKLMTSGDKEVVSKAGYLLGFIYATSGITYFKADKDTRVILDQRIINPGMEYVDAIEYLQRSAGLGFQHSAKLLTGMKLHGPPKAGEPILIQVNDSFDEFSDAVKKNGA